MKKVILLPLICLVSTAMIVTPAFSGPPYYHEEGNVNYPGSYFESLYTAIGIGVDDYITLVDIQLILIASPSWSSNLPWGIGNGMYNPDCDMNNDGTIGALDFGTAMYHFSLNYHYSHFEAVPGPTIVTVNVPADPIMVGQQFAVGIAVDWVDMLDAYEFTLSWNPALLKIVSIADGSFGFGADGGPLSIIGDGYVYVSDQFNYPPDWVSGSGTLAQITFECKGAGSTILDLSSRLFEYWPSFIQVPHQDEDGTVIQLDTIPPIANAGPDQTVDKGTLVEFDGSGSYDNVGIVSYVWTFIDVTPQTLSGVNPTYTFTSSGVYVVNLNVSDAAGNHATDTVTISVLGPEDHTQALIQTIQTWNIAPATKTSLTSKLYAVLDLLDQENYVGAMHKLMDFVSQVEALRGKKLTDQQADYLIAEAQRIISLLTR